MPRSASASASASASSLLRLLPFFTLVLLPLLLATTTTGADAHFVLNFPKARGSEEDLQAQGPCGGYNTPSTPRTPFPIQGGSIQYLSAHPQATFQINFATAAAPTNFLPVEPTQSTPSGTFNATVNLGKLNANGVKVGTEGTIQMTYDGGDGTLYQCGDVVLVAAVGGSSGNSTAGQGSSSTSAGNPSSSTGQPSSSGSNPLLVSSLVYVLPTLLLGVVTFFN